MFTVVHTGYDPISPDKVHATPEMLRAVVEKYKKLKLVAAHMGGFRKSEGVLRHLVGTNIYLDTSLSALRLDERENLYKILDNHDENRILFATDTPWTKPKEEIEFVENAPISDAKKEKIFYKNALALLNIK
jgi:predicted TIM-barrel fold metal-dependent hydrolase